MKEKYKDYEFCIKVALDNAKKRINLLDNFDRKCVMEEYKEWINDGLNKHTVLLLRDDPIIQERCENIFLILCTRSNPK